MDKIILSGVSLMCRVGVPEEERTKPQRIFVDLEIDADVAAAASTDDVRQTINYAEVRNELEVITNGDSFRLIETIAQRMANSVLLFPGARAVRLRVRKPGALAHLGVDYAAVEIVRSRNG